MTRHEAYEWAKQTLVNNRISDADSSARFLLLDTLECSLTDYMTESDVELTDTEEDSFRQAVARRMQHEPIAYILGKQPFMGFELKVTPDTLIPRSETEQLIQLAISHLQTTRQLDNQTTLIDLATGSGAIAITLARWLKHNSLPDKVIGTDISPEALAVAQHNAKINKADDRIEFIQSNLLDFLNQPANQLTSKPVNPVIITNLPYIPTARLPQLQPEVRNFEPTLALDGGLDGLDLYRRLFDQIDKLPNKPTYLFGEIDETQGQPIQNLIKTHWPNTKTSVGQDLAGFDRFITIKF